MQSIREKGEKLEENVTFRSKLIRRIWKGN